MSPASHGPDSRMAGAWAVTSPAAGTARATGLGQRPPDPDRSAWVAARYREGAEADDPASLTALYRPDVLVDTHVPNWRFQLQGAEAAAERACLLPRPGRFTAFDIEPTERGLQVQFEWHQGASETVVRQLHWWRLVDGQIAEQVVFCAGVWDRRLRALMAAKAPLVRA